MDRRIQGALRAGNDEEVLLGKVRTGEELTIPTVVKALQTGVKGNVLALIQQANVPETERALQFLKHLEQYDQEARETLDHYELVQEGDVAPPDTKTALRALSNHLKAHPHHIEVLDQMHRPVYQLVPVYENEGVGFQRMVNAIDAHRREELGQAETTVLRNLQNTLGMDSQASGKITGWQMAVVEGAKELPQESNPYSGQGLEDQLIQSQEDAKRRDLQLCDKKKYALLQMREIQQAALDTSLGQLGIDVERWTILEDPTRQPGSLVLIGHWSGVQVFFFGRNPAVCEQGVCFRSAVVVDL